MGTDGTLNGAMKMRLNFGMAFFPFSHLYTFSLILFANGWDSRRFFFPG